MLRFSTGRRDPASGRRIRVRPLTACSDALTQISMKNQAKTQAACRLASERRKEIRFP